MTTTYDFTNEAAQHYIDAMWAAHAAGNVDRARMHWDAASALLVNRSPEVVREMEVAQGLADNPYSNPYNRSRHAY